MLLFQIICMFFSSSTVYKEEGLGKMLHQSCLPNLFFSSPSLLDQPADIFSLDHFQVPREDKDSHLGWSF